MPRFEMRPYRFSMRDSERFRAGAERMRVRLHGRSDEPASRMRLRDFDSHDMAMRMRNHAFAMRDDARRHQMGLRDKDMDRMGDRIRDRMDHFRFDRPMTMRRHSRAI